MLNQKAFLLLHPSFFLYKHGDSWGEGVTSHIFLLDPENIFFGGHEAQSGGTVLIQTLSVLQIQGTPLVEDLASEVPKVPLVFTKMLTVLFCNIN